MNHDHEYKASTGVQLGWISSLPRVASRDSHPEERLQGLSFNRRDVFCWSLRTPIMSKSTASKGWGLAMKSSSTHRGHLSSLQSQYLWAFRTMKTLVGCSCPEPPGLRRKKITSPRPTWKLADSWEWKVFTPTGWPEEQLHKCKCSLSLHNIIS